jgi:DNA modification methylase
MSGRVEQIGDCMLVLGDCREVLPTLGRVDAVVSDPPYGIQFRYGGEYRDLRGSAYVNMLAALKPFPRCLLQYPEETMEYFVPLFGAPNECFIWVYNSNIARQARIFSFWGLDVDLSRVRVPAKNPTDPRVSSLVTSYDWTADFQQVKNVSREKTKHPCQVPSGLMERIVTFIRSDTVIDPFMGSGTTGVACVKLGRKFIGIEIEPKYFDIACRRIEAAYAQPDLFIEPAPKEVQPSLFEAAA